MALVKKYLLFLSIIFITLIITLWDKTLGSSIFLKIAINFKDMAGVLPPIFLIMGLMDEWVPRETMVKFLGDDSGARGVLLSIFLGSAAAGPLYAAFPIAGMMLKKEASFKNVIIFLWAWSTLKIPMFLFEMKAMGVPFAVTRWIVNVIGIVLLSHIMVYLISIKDREAVYAYHKSSNS